MMAVTAVGLVVSALATMADKLDRPPLYRLRRLRPKRHTLGMRGDLGLLVSSADRARLASIIGDRRSGPQKHVWRAEVVLMTVIAWTRGSWRLEPAQGRRVAWPPLCEVGDRRRLLGHSGPGGWSTGCSAVRRKMT